jgi:hypothetical protein
MKKILEVENYMWCRRHHDVSTPAITHENSTRAGPTHKRTQQPGADAPAQVNTAGRACAGRTARERPDACHVAARDQLCHTGSRLPHADRASRAGIASRRWHALRRCRLTRGAGVRTWPRRSGPGRLDRWRRPVAVCRSAGWLGQLAPLFFCFLPQNARFSAETPDSPPVQALKTGSRQVFTSTASGTFPCTLQCRGEAGCAPRKRVRTSTLPSLPL